MGGGGGGGGHDPGEGEEASGGFLRGVQVVKAGAFGAGHKLRVVRAAVTGLVPLHAGLGVITIGGDLHGGPGTVFVEPAQQADQLAFPPVSPEAEAVRFGRVDAKLGAFARLHLAGPDVTEDPIGEQAEVVRLGLGEIESHPFRTETRGHERDVVLARGEIDQHRPSGGRLHNRPGLLILLEFDLHPREGHKAFVTDVANKH